MNRGRSAERARAAAVRHHQQRMMAAAAARDGLHSTAAPPFYHSSTSYEAPIEEEPTVSLGEDYYAVLQVERTASAEDIKKGFRRLALLYHPDKNVTGDQQVELQFKRIKRAYEVLSSDELRNVYDRHGEDGAQTYEMILQQQRMGMGSGSTKRKWVIVFTVWPLIILLDHYFNTACEWVIAWLGTAFFVGPLMQSILSEFTNVTNLFVSWVIGMTVLLSVDGLLYYFLPLAWALPLASLMLHATLVGWLNTEKPNWDVGFVTYAVLTGLDYWRGVPTRWPLGAYHVIAHCSVFIVVLAAYHIKTPLPAHHSYIKSLLVDPIISPLISLTWTFFWRILSIHFLGNILFFLWIPIWLLDSYFAFPVEWILISSLSLFIFAKIHMVSLFFEIKRITKLIWVCVLVFPLLFIHHFMPIVYLPHLVNALVHFISFLGIVISDYKLSKKEKKKKRSITPAGFGEYVLGTFFFVLAFIYFDYFRRDLLYQFLQEEARTGKGARFYFALFTFVCCIFFLFIFVLPTLLLGLKNILERERKKRTSGAAVQDDGLRYAKASANGADGKRGKQHEESQAMKTPSDADMRNGHRTAETSGPKARHKPKVAENGDLAATKSMENSHTSHGNGSQPKVGLDGNDSSMVKLKGSKTNVPSKPLESRESLLRKEEAQREREREKEREREREKQKRKEQEEAERLVREKSEREQRERQEAELRKAQEELEQKMRSEPTVAWPSQHAASLHDDSTREGGSNVGGESSETSNEDEEETIEINLEDLQQLDLIDGELTDSSDEDEMIPLPVQSDSAIASPVKLDLPKDLSCSFCGRKGTTGASAQATDSSSKPGKGKARGKRRGSAKEEPVELKMCGGCKAAFYCDVHCQTAHWPQHSRRCVHALTRQGPVS